jgi:hypothetical protein
VHGFRPLQFVEDVVLATRLEIEVRSATTRHVATVGQVLWCDGGSSDESCGG